MGLVDVLWGLGLHHIEVLGERQVVVSQHAITNDFFEFLQPDSSAHAEQKKYEGKGEHRE